MLELYSDRTYQNRIHTDCPNVVDNMDFRRDPEHTGQELPVEARPALSEAWPEVQSGTLDGTWMNNPSHHRAMHLKQERTANYRHHLWYRLHTRHLAHLLGRFRRLRRHLWYRIHRPYLRHFSRSFRSIHFFHLGYCSVTSVSGTLPPAAVSAISGGISTGSFDTSFP